MPDHRVGTVAELHRPPRLPFGRPGLRPDSPAAPRSARPAPPAAPAAGRSQREAAALSGTGSSGTTGSVPHQRQPGK
jgi:hypothetical protein